MNTTPERRQRRTSDLFLALHYLLANQRERAGMNLALLSDEDGLLIAFDGDSEACEEYAAYAPFIARGESYVIDSRKLANVSAHAFSINGHAMYLLLRGEGDDVSSAACVIAAISGAARILTE